MTSFLGSLFGLLVQSLTLWFLIDALSLFWPFLVGFAAPLLGILVFVVCTHKSSQQAGLAIVIFVTTPL